ncbi:solute carrier family 43, member 1, partial [Chelydra serpentina]
LLSPPLSWARKKIKLSGLALDHRVTGDRFYTHVTTVGQRLSQKGPCPQEGKELCPSTQDLYHGATMPSEYSIPFRRSVCSPIFLWSLITMGMTQLRVIFYMAAMNKMLEFQVTGSGQDGEGPAGSRGVYWIHRLCSMPSLSPVPGPQGPTEFHRGRPMASRAPAIPVCFLGSLR